MADELFNVVASGQVQIRIDQRYPLAQVQQAHRDLEARKTRIDHPLALKFANQPMRALYPAVIQGWWFGGSCGSRTQVSPSIRKSHEIRK
jgi:hypothetical protein